jgi:hypothetical protein
MADHSLPGPGGLACAVAEAAAAAAKHTESLEQPSAVGRADPRFLNIEGKVIQTHRALRRFDFTVSRMLSVFLLPAVLSALVFFAWPLIAMLWAGMIQFWVGYLGPDVVLARQDFLIPGMTNVPYPQVVAALPDAAQWRNGLIAVGVLFFLPIVFPPKMLPITYLMRFIGMLQLAVQVYFYFWAANFPHSADSTIATMMQTSMALMLIVPWLYGFIYNIFGFSLWRKIALSVMALAYLIILTPVQYTLAAVLMLKFSLLWHPLIYLLGATLLQLIALLALYAWAMSWDRPAAEQ